jgi:transposase
MTTMNPEHCRAARAWFNITQKDLATASRTSVAQVVKFENHKPVLRSTHRSITRTLTRMGITFLENGVVSSREGMQAIIIDDRRRYRPVVQERRRPMEITDEIREVVRLYYDEGCTATDIAETMRMKNGRVYRLLVAYERITGEIIKRHNRGYRKQASDRAQEIVAAYKGGKTLHQIAAEVRTSRQRISQIINDYEKRTGKNIERHKTTPPPRRTEPSPGMVRAANLYKSGVRIFEIAKIMPGHGVYNLIQRYEELTGETIPRHKDLPKPPTQDMVEAAWLYREGPSIIAISKRIDRPMGSITSLVKKYAELTGDPITMRGKTAGFVRHQQKKPPLTDRLIKNPLQSPYTPISMLPSPTPSKVEYPRQRPLKRPGARF